MSRVSPHTMDWSVYVIIDPAHMHEAFTCEEMALEVLEGGADILQLRDKRSSDRTYLDRARRLQSLCEARGATFIVNDRIDIALAADADGVHLGPNDLPIETARSLAPDLLVGGSAGTVERARRLEHAGADYLGSGAIYDAGASKPDASEPRGPEAIRQITSAVDLPVIGIGGIRAENAPSVIEAGADGVAVIRAIVADDDPETATRELREVVTSARTR